MPLPRSFVRLAIFAVAFFAVAASALRSSAGEPQRLTVGAGCFWCVEAVYERIDGVIEAVSGYAGGKEANPTYDDVSYGRTTHAEVVQITFDPDKVSLAKLLEIFWKTHDVTDGRGVYPDFGPQYRSMLLYENDAQLAEIEKSKAEAQKGLSKPIATQVVKLDKFWPAEAYHQDFVKRNPTHPYVLRHAFPKLKKLGLPEAEGQKKKL
ncbi:MAG: peptide-methionine (S)-S-oxide reductase MsrA [Verrucomicrobia bacterium]|nr:peptide-methionine (S)-S-oxide reductase MsrA [Verrucomicrobiota bacterium]